MDEKQQATSYHISVSIRSFVEMGKDNFCKVYGDTAFVNDDGTPLTSEQAYDGLVQEFAAGREIIIGAGCDNFDPKTGCRGHIK